MISVSCTKENKPFLMRSKMPLNTCRYKEIDNFFFSNLKYNEAP